MITKPTLCDGMPIDVERLIETRMLIQSNSGGGKSWALRRLLEQTASSVQQLVIDPEGEFATLRERFDYIIAAPHDADAVATPKTAALLARRLLETGVSAVLNIYDLKAHERQAFVRIFLDALTNAPRALWHPTLVVLDEAHVFCPQSGSAEASGAVIDVATRGRKRGQGLVLATQRLSKLHKDAAAEMLNKLVGRTGLDVDVKRAADELGLSARDAMTTLRDLKPGEFYAFGPALSARVVRTRIGPVITTHPRPGDRLMKAPPPASRAVLAKLAQLADLQREAEVEATTLEQVRHELTKARQDLARALKGAPPAPPVPAPLPAAVIEREVARRVALAQREAYAKGMQAGASLARSEVLRRMPDLADQIRDAMNAKATPSETAQNAPGSTQPVGDANVRRPTAPHAGARSAAKATPIRPMPTGDGLTGPEQRVLDAIAWMNDIGVDAPEVTAVAFLAGYTAGGGSFNNTRGALRSKGLVQYLNGGGIVLTDSGRAQAAPPPKLATTAELHDRILARLPGPERKLLTVLLEAHPSEMANETLADRTGYTHGGGSFNNTRGRLRSLGLIEYPRAGFARARDILFPRGLKP